MKKTLFSLLFLLFIVFNSFSQLKLIRGTVFDQEDTTKVLDSALVILYDYNVGLGYHYDFDEEWYDTTSRKRSFYYTRTDSNGVFSFKNVLIPQFDYQDSSAPFRLAIEIISPDHSNYETYIEPYEMGDSIYDFDAYLSPFNVPERPVVVKRENEPGAWRFDGYLNFILFGGSLIGSQEYQTNYKVGFSLSKNYKITSVNYLGWDLNPVMYRRYYMRGDTVNTLPSYTKEYFASVQSGLFLYFRTHIFSWPPIMYNALYVDLGIEYNLPWHYWYVEKPDHNSKFVLKNFHKYNEFYLNAKVGMTKGIALKGQYRLGDNFKGSYLELPRWSVELQAVFFIDGWEE